MTQQHSKRRRKDGEGRRKREPGRRKRKSTRRQRRRSRLAKRWNTNATASRDVIVVALGHLDDRDHQGERFATKLTTGEDLDRKRRHGETDAHLHIVRLLLEGKENGEMTTQATGETVSMWTGTEVRRFEVRHSIIPLLLLCVTELFDRYMIYVPREEYYSAMIPF